MQNLACLKWGRVSDSRRTLSKFPYTASTMGNAETGKTGFIVGNVGEQFEGYLRVN